MKKKFIVKSNDIINKQTQNNNSKFFYSGINISLPKENKNNDVTNLKITQIKKYLNKNDSYDKKSELETNFKTTTKNKNIMVNILEDMKQSF